MGVAGEVALPILGLTDDGCELGAAGRSATAGSLDIVAAEDEMLVRWFA